MSYACRYMLLLHLHILSCQPCSHHAQSSMSWETSSLMGKTVIICWKYLLMELLGKDNPKTNCLCFIKKRFKYTLCSSNCFGLFFSECVMVKLDGHAGTYGLCFLKAMVLRSSAFILLSIRHLFCMNVQSGM